MYRVYTYIGLLLMSLLVPLTVSATTLDWDRNSETDMQDYRVFACFTPGCIVTLTPTMLQGTVLQSAVGVRPLLLIDLTNKEGKLAVSARDTALNESGLSVPLGFDFVGPTIPKNLLLK